MATKEVSWASHAMGLVDEPQMVSIPRPDGGTERLRLQRLEAGLVLQGFPLRAVSGGPVPSDGRPWRGLVLTGATGVLVVPMLFELEDAVRDLNAHKGWWGETPWMVISVGARVELGRGYYRLPIEVSVQEDEPRELAEHVKRPRPWRGL